MRRRRSSAFSRLIWRIASRAKKASSPSRAGMKSTRLNPWSSWRRRNEHHAAPADSVVRSGIRALLAGTAHLARWPVRRHDLARRERDGAVGRTGGKAYAGHAWDDAG